MGMTRLAVVGARDRRGMFEDRLTLCIGRQLTSHPLLECGQHTNDDAGLMDAAYLKGR